MRNYRGKESMKSKVLKFVEEAGAARFTDIQRFIVDEKFGKGTYDTANKTDKVMKFTGVSSTGEFMYTASLVNPYRGHYTSAFSAGGTWGRKGYFLVSENRLEKGEDRLYRVVRGNK